MERYSYMENHQAFMDSTSNQVCSSPGTFFGGSRLMGNLSISNRNSVLTDDSGVFEDAISKSDSIDFGDPSNPLLSFSSPAPRSRKSESEQCDEADSPEQLEACMNPLFMMNSWGDNSNSPEHQKKPTDPSPKHQQLQQTNSVTENKQNTFLSSNNQDPNSETKTGTVNGIPKRMPRPNSIDLLSFDHYAATYQSSSSDSRYKGRFRIEETTPTPAKKLVNSLNCSPMKEANNNFSGPQFSNEVVIRPIGVNHNNNRRISYIECDSVEALNSKDPPNSSNNDPTIITSPCLSPPTSSASSLSQLNIYLDDGCTLSDTQESTLTYNSLDGFYEDNPILQGCNFMSPTAACSSTSSCNTASSSNSSSGSASGSKRNSTRRKISSGSNTNQNRHQNQQQQQSSSSSITSPSCQLRSQQPRVAPKYEKAHLYPKKYGKTESMPEHQIYVELHQLEEMLKELQMKGTQIEQVLHCIGKESGAKTRSEESVLLGEWLELVRSKNRIVRRENELMHILNQRELEEIQEAIIDKMRHLMTIEEKSDVEKAEEERLLANLLQVVEKRNGIVQILEQDRLNEEIEDQKCEDLLSPEKLRDATTRQKTWKSVMSTFKTSKWANNVKSYYNLNSKSLQY